MSNVINFLERKKVVSGGGNPPDMPTQKKMMENPQKAEFDSGEKKVIQYYGERYDNSFLFIWISLFIESLMYYFHFSFPSNFFWSIFLFLFLGSIYIRFLLSVNFSPADWKSEWFFSLFGEFCALFFLKNNPRLSGFVSEWLFIYILLWYSHVREYDDFSTKSIGRGVRR